MAIPRVIHFIWLGKPLPERYAKNIVAIQRAGRDAGFAVKLWVSPGSAELNRERVTRGAGDGGQAVDVEVCGLERLRPRFNVAFGDAEVARTLHRIVDTERNGAANYAAASDIVRMQVLFTDGGYYFDTDVRPERDAAMNSVPLDDSSHVGATFLMAPLDRVRRVVYTPFTMIDAHRPEFVRPRISRAEGTGAGLRAFLAKKVPGLARLIEDRPGQSVDMFDGDCWALGAVARHTILEVALHSAALRYSERLWTHRGPDDRWNAYDHKRIGIGREMTGRYSSMYPLRDGIAADYFQRHAGFTKDGGALVAMETTQLFRLDVGRTTPQHIALRMGVTTDYDNTWRGVAPPSRSFEAP